MSRLDENLGREIAYEQGRVEGASEERVACAALVGTAGCQCPRRAKEEDWVKLSILHERTDGKRQSLGYTDRHVRWCPVALAAFIEARGAILPACPSESATTPPEASSERQPTSIPETPSCSPLEPPPSDPPSPRSSGARSGPTSNLLKYGYASGSYASVCSWCGRTFEGADKRATTCLPCATEMAAGAPQEGGQT
jgi:hypothetical protein